MAHIMPRAHFIADVAIDTDEAESQPVPEGGGAGLVYWATGAGVA